MMSKMNTMDKLSNILLLKADMHRLIRVMSHMLGIMLVIALSGCHDALFDREIDPEYTPCETDQMVEVAIPVDLSLFATPVSTRALTTERESFIDPATSRLFVFDQSARTLLYESSIKAISASASDPQSGKIKARLKPSTTPVTAVLYGNISAEMKGISVDPGMSADNLAELFTFHRATDLSVELLPLWGETTISTISSAQVTAETLHLLRSVARVDVGLNMTALTNSGGKDPDFNETAQVLKGTISGTEVTFTLAKAILYNVSSKGRVAPTSGNYMSADHRVVRPSLLSGTPNLTAQIDYSDKISENILRREIYIPETDNSSATLGVEERPFLVVGLTYTGRTQPTYYRIDFMTKDTAGKYSYLSLLRNYRYKVNIHEVNGPGYDTPEEAAKAPATRLKYQVMAFEESEMDHVAYDGPYRLSVDLDHISVGRYGSVATVHVGTNWPKGWSVEIPERVTPIGSTTEVPNPLAQDQSWITFENYVLGGPNKPTTDTGGLEMSIKPLAETSTQPRDGYLYIRAGRMRWLLHVEQTASADFDIRIFSDEMGKLPLQFIELSQLGLKAGLTTSKGAKREIPGYRRFYVRTDPYIDPNTAVGRDFIPFWSDQRTSTFYFWDFSEDFSTSPTDADLMGTVKTDGKYPHQWTAVDQRAGTGSLFRYTGHDNIWECIITAPPMRANKDPKDADFYERRDNTYRANIQVPGQESTRAYGELRVLQMEYNVVPYFDDKYKEQMIRPDSTGFYLMDGQTQMLYINGNTDCVLKFVQAESDVTDATDLIIPLDRTRPLLASQLPFGLKFMTADDMPTGRKAATRYHGYATWEISSPNELFESYTVTVELASGVYQPEANTYLIKADSKLGLLIPVSMVNTAADYYEALVKYDKEHNGTNLRKFESMSEYEKRSKSFIGNVIDLSLNRVNIYDKVTPWMVWTDINRPIARDGSVDLRKGGIGRLRTYYQKDGRQYVYFLPSGARNTISNEISSAGSVLVGLRNESIEGAPNVWSWLIWIVDEYPQKAVISGGKGNQTLTMLDRPVGSRRIPQSNYSGDTWAAGFAYQWGRKDPFPWRRAIVDNPIKQVFWDATGSVYSFPANARGTRGNRGTQSVADGMGATYTLKQSIENPAKIVGHQTVWMSEHLPFGTTSNSLYDALEARATWRWMWESPIEDISKLSDANNIPANKNQGYKTPFDPSPYGFRIINQPEQYTLCYGLYLTATPAPGKIYSITTGLLVDGDYGYKEEVPRFNGGQMIAVSSYKDPRQWNEALLMGKQYGGHYLLGYNAGAGGWRDNYTVSGSLGNKDYNRACGHQCYPTLDTKTVSSFDEVTKYWPMYKK